MSGCLMKPKVFGVNAPRIMARIGSESNFKAGLKLKTGEEDRGFVRRDGTGSGGIGR